MVEPKVIEEKIRAHIDGITQVKVTDLTGTQDHFEAVVVAKSFETKTRIEQHQLVYQALGDLMSGPIHALALKTSAPTP